METDFLRITRDQILFVGTFFAIFGLVMTDSYYTQFGIKYQFIGIDYTHILYRGFTLIYFNIYFALIFLIIVFSVLLSRINFNIVVRRRAISGKILLYIFLMTSLVGGSYLAFVAGSDKAVSDMYVDSTSLRQITEFYSKDGAKAKFISGMLDNNSIVLLLHSSVSELVIFQPPSLRASRPRIDVHHVRLASDDYFSDRVPVFR